MGRRCRQCRSRQQAGVGDGDGRRRSIRRRGATMIGRRASVYGSEMGGIAPRRPRHRASRARARARRVLLAGLDWCSHGFRLCALFSPSIVHRTLHPSQFSFYVIFFYTSPLLSCLSPSSSFRLLPTYSIYSTYIIREPVIRIARTNALYFSSLEGC